MLSETTRSDAVLRRLREADGVVSVHLTGRLNGHALAPGSYRLLASAISTATPTTVSASVTQIVVPLSASLADEADRGRVVGTVMSGLLIGILAAADVDAEPDAARLLAPVLRGFEVRIDRLRLNVDRHRRSRRSFRHR